MRYINIRQFSKNMKEEIKDLPITVTKYGVPVFVVESCGVSLDNE